jgi:hypothetical protein
MSYVQVSIVFFHLWNNGTPHREREKRAWEIEQEKEWTKVLSKSSKKAAAKSQKKVSFAKNLVHHSPVTPPPVKDKYLWVPSLFLLIITLVVWFLETTICSLQMNPVVFLLTLKNVHFVKLSKYGTDFTIAFLSSRWSKNIYGTSNPESE